MGKIIKFVAEDDYAFNVKSKPVPASEYLPDWFKTMPSFVDNKLVLSPSPSVTAKKCAPLMDGLISGYIMPLWADIYVSQTEEGPYINWTTETEVLGAWPWQQSSNYEIPDGFDRTVFKYYHGWIIETPKEYSCLITHPIGYPNLPFKTITGIIDSDILKTGANSPFVVKKGFEGIIKKGTPMFQIIPIKRDEWKSEFDMLDAKNNFFNIEKLRTKIISAYSSKRARKIYR